MRKKIVAAFLTLSAMILSGNVAAQSDNYPSKPVRIISPFPPGGSVDTVGRLIAARLTESYGQTFVIDNRSGASGSIGMELVANAPPDGYTLVINTLPLITNQFLFGKLPFDALRDFAPISLVTTTASVFIAHPSFPAKTVRELIALAGSRRDAIHYGGAGPGTNPHIAGELFNHLAKTNLAIIQFKGGGPAMIATVSGEISITIPAVTDGLPFIRSGRLRPLGVTSTRRVPQLPDVPAIAETLPGYEFASWQGLLAPKNTPRAIVTSLSERIKKSLAVAENAKRFSEGGLDIVASTPDEFAAHLKIEAAKWGKVIRERGLKID